MYLSVPLPPSGGGKLTLRQCIEEFMKEEVLDGDNLWRCFRCKEFRPATKALLLESRWLLVSNAQVFLTKLIKVARRD